MTVKQSGKTQGESDCKAGRKNSRRKSTCNCLFLSTPREIFHYFDGFCLQSFDFATVLAQFSGRNLPVALPFFFPAFICLIFRFFGYLFVWLFLLHSIIAALRSIIATVIATGFAQFFGRNLPVTLPFLFRPLFGLFFGYFWFFCLFLVPLISLSLLSTP